MYDNPQYTINTQYFQIAFLDDELQSKEDFLSRSFSSKKFLIFQKKKLKKTKIKLNINFLLNNLVISNYIYFSFLSKSVNKYFIFKNTLFKRFLFRNSFLQKLKLKVKRKRNNIMFIYESGTRFKQISQNFLNYWYAFFYNTIMLNNLKPYNNQTIKPLITFPILIHSFQFIKNFWNFKINWLGIDLDNVQPLIEMGNDFFFRKLIYHFFFKKMIFKKLHWLFSFRKFFFKNNKILKRQILSREFKFFKKIIKTQNLNTNFNRFKKNFRKYALRQSFYLKFMENNLFKIYLALKSENTSYRSYIHRKWYFTRKMSTFLFKSKHTHYINRKERFLIKKIKTFNPIKKIILSQKYLFNESFQIVTEDFLKVKNPFKKYFWKIFIKMVNPNKLTNYCINYESNFLINSFLKDFKFYSLKNFKKSYKMINYNYKNWIELDKKINLKIKFFKNKISFKKKYIQNNLPFKSYQNKNPIKIKYFNNKYTIIKSNLKKFEIFYKNLDTNFYNLFFQKKFEKFFYFFYFSPIWSMTNNLKQNQLFKFIEKFIFLNPSKFSLYNSNIFLELDEDPRNFNVNRFILKNKPILKITKIFENQLIIFLENFMQRNVCLQTSINLNTKYITKSNFVDNMYRRFYNMQVFFGKNFFLKEMIEIFLWFFRFKDLSIFETWFIKAMHKLPPKKHRKFLLFLKSCICNYFSPLFNASGMKGFFMRISGKISVTGNAKTRSQYIKWGVFGTSKKDNKLELTQNIIRTNTGVLGVLIMISY